MSDAYETNINPNAETGEVNAHDVEDVGTQTGAGSGNTLRLYRPRVVIGGTSRAAVGVVTNTTPGVSDYGLVVRTIGTTTVDVTSVIPGTGATNLGKAEDSAHTTGDTGVFILAVRNDGASTTLAGTNFDYTPISVTASGEVFTVGQRAEDAGHTSGDRGKFVLGVRQDTDAAVTSTDGDYSLIAVDSAGRLKTAETIVDDAAFTVGTSKVFPIGAMFDDTSTDTVDEGDVGIPRMTSERVLLTNSTYKTATGSGTGVGIVVDSVDVIGYGYVSVQLSGTWSATVRFEVSDDNSNWEVCTLIKTTDRNFYDTTQATGIYAGPISGRYFRVRVQPYTSGTIEVTVVFSANSTAVLASEVSGDIPNDSLDGTSNPIKIGGRANAAVPTAVITNDRVNTWHDLNGRLMTSGAFAEDGAHTSGEFGTFILGVRNDSNTSFSGTDADYTPIAVDAGGHPLVAGSVAHDAADANYPVKIGGKARTTNPTAVADADRVDATFDDIGRQIQVPFQVRDLSTHQSVQIVNSTAETTILTAGAAGVFHDLTCLIVSNQSTTTPTTVTIKDATAGTTRMIFTVGANSTVSVPFSSPVNQATAAGNWTATLSNNTTTLDFFVQAVKNV